MENRLGYSIIDSIKTKELDDLVIDGLDITIDSFLKNGFLKEIPVFSLLSKIYGVVIDIRTALFEKKIYYFLYGIRNLSIEERNIFIENLENEQGGKAKLGENIINIIEHVDDTEKALYIGKLFSACGRNYFSISRLFRLVNIVERLFINDIKALKKIENNKKFTIEEINAYISVGIMDNNIDIVPSIMPKPLSKDQARFINNLNVNAYLLADILFNIRSEDSNRYLAKVEEDAI